MPNRYAGSKSSKMIPQCICSVFVCLNCVMRYALCVTTNNLHIQSTKSFENIKKTATDADEDKE